MSYVQIKVILQYRDIKKIQLLDKKSLLVHNGSKLTSKFIKCVQC